jgi:hypothetical protein
LKEEIRKRFSSGSWDLAVARAVVRKKRRTTISTAAAGAALAVFLAVSVLLGSSALFPRRRGGDASGDAFFVAKQVEGTHNAVFAASSALGSYPAAPISSITFDGIDELIDETLENR